MILFYRQSGSCAHIGALLYVCAEIISNGYNLPSQISCTDELCKWVVFQSAHVDPVQVKDMVISSHPSFQQRKCPDFDLEDNEMLQWEESVREMYDDIACKPGPNPVGLQLLHPDRFSNLKLPPASVPLISLPDQMYSLDEPLVHHIDIEIDQPDPPRICDLFDMMSFKENSTSKQKLLEFKEKLITSYDSSDVDYVELITRGQWRDPKWFHHKNCAIGASEFIKIRRVTEGGRHQATLTKQLRRIYPS